MNISYNIKTTDNGNGMRGFEWIGKTLVGAFGTIASVLLENISLIMSIIAAIMTIIFLVYNIRYVKHKTSGIIASNKYHEDKRKENVKKDN